MIPPPSQSFRPCAAAAGIAVPAVVASLLAAIGGISSADDGALSAFDPSPFRFQRPIHSDGNAEGVAAIALDPHLFEHTGSSFPSLRLVRTADGTSREWPYRLDRVEAPPAPGQRTRTSTRNVSFDTRADGSLELVVEASNPGFPAERIEIDTPLRNFERRISIDGSDDGTEWRTLVEDALLVDRQRFVDFRRTTVPLPGGAHRFYRLRIDEASDEQRFAIREMTRTFSGEEEEATEEKTTVERRDFRIDAVRLARDAEKLRRRTAFPSRAYPVETISITENGEKQRTEILLASSGAPLTCLKLETRDRNFRRRVRVEIPRDDPGQEDGTAAPGPGGTNGRDWHQVGSGTVHRYDIEGLKESRLDIAIPEQRNRHFRLLVENLDSTPLRIESISAEGPRYEMRFLPEPGGTWTLYYGGEDGDEDGAPGPRAPRYDLAALDRALGSGLTTRGAWNLGDPVSNPAYSPPPPPPAPPWWERPALLYGVIIFAVAGLVILLFRAGRAVQIQESDGDG